MAKLIRYGLWFGYVLGVGWLGFGMWGWQFLVGNVIAVCLGLVDRLVYVWWLYPFEQSSIQIQYWTRKKDVKAVVDLLVAGSLNQQKLILRSVGFALIWVLLAVYVTSSTGSIVAMGIVMGLGYDLVWNIIKDWKRPTQLSGWFCWQIKRRVLENEVRWCGGALVVIWIMFVFRLVLG